MHEGRNNNGRKDAHQTKKKKRSRRPPLKNAAAAENKRHNNKKQAKQAFVGLESGFAGSGDPAYPGGRFFNFAGLGTGSPAEMKTLKLKEIKNGEFFFSSSSSSFSPSSRALSLPFAVCDPFLQKPTNPSDSPPSPLLNEPLNVENPPPQTKTATRNKNNPIKKGRLAMVAMLGFGAQAVMTGEGPVTNLAEHLASPSASNILTNLVKVGGAL